MYGPGDVRVEDRPDPADQVSGHGRVGT